LPAKVGSILGASGGFGTFVPRAVSTVSEPFNTPRCTAGAAFTPAPAKTVPIIFSMSAAGKPVFSAIHAAPFWKFSPM
jgi:hypothetical protein